MNYDRLKLRDDKTQNVINSIDLYGDRNVKCHEFNNILAKGSQLEYI